ncbi:MAG: UDP-N-acetylmuramate:L-alanyl-gamma-D-glutamyl-meso-diaminopimelate ligase [Proteobacteria bacterium]|nr:UDP-N-acetylmuramate:L-alanyl-gamma-D-glutamyl-meso-diaminopimelate ligase [Pseudomonadota bacterium]
MKLHILGICGTFMGGVAAIARSLGHQVSGSDQNVYPPMSTQLEELGITMYQGYDDLVLQEQFDQVVVGNVMTRGMPVIESLLESSKNYVSGPEWLGEQVLQHKRVYAIAGTHGKTTTSSMLAWIMQDNGLEPGFLIGGVCLHFKKSARINGSESFVIEADEYDSAFFDKRSKFIHYHPNVLVLNNLEFDHADIFKDLDAIKTQFHHLIQTIPQNARIIFNNDEANLKDVLHRGCWTPCTSFGTDSTADYWIKTSQQDARSFSVYQQAQKIAEINWKITGIHNQLNALAAILAAQEAGITIKQAAKSLEKFKNVKRRMELICDVNQIKIYDDFAHHPTAIKTTLEGLRKTTTNRIIAVLEPRSNSMRTGFHAALLPESLKAADISFVMVYPEMDWDIGTLKKLNTENIQTIASVDALLDNLSNSLKPNDQVVFMSNGGFENAPLRLADMLIIYERS